MGKKHLKRKPAPKFWPIHRKEFVWTVRPKPGPHPTSRCIPLALIVRDILKLAKTRKEAKTIISQGKIKVNGKLQLDELFPTGLMDVISIPEMKKTYRILPSEKGLILHSIGPEEALFKLCRIENKKVIKGGHTQLNLHDGRNIQVQVETPQKPEENVYQTLNVLKTSIPGQEITAHLKLSEDVHAIIVGGKNAGKYGKIVTVEKRPSQKRRDSRVTIEDENGNRFQTTLNFIFGIGDTRPWISLPEDD